jgi:hypothetical protein
MSPFLAAYIASIFAIVLTVILVFVRSKQIVAFFQPQVTDVGELNAQKVRVWGTVFAIIINLMFALVAAVAFRYFGAWFGVAASMNFVVAAFAFTFLFTTLAILTRREGLVFEKVSLNLIFGLAYGILIPILA